MSENKNIDELQKKIKSCIRSKDPDTCVNEAIQFVSKNGIDGIDLLELSILERINENYETAYVYALAATQCLDENEKAQSYHNAALIEVTFGDQNKAEDYFRKALELSPEYLRAHYNYANLLDNQGRTDEAKKHYEEAKSLEAKI
ncbi:MAG: tetratricopeptide repeat protein [Methanohalobium sp.]|uniref:tetratricopeptide repeat protein n=1 Tax=Methanohalobium sp. TaxID=2837493 RepID=UPI00397DD59D